MAAITTAPVRAARFLLTLIYLSPSILQPSSGGMLLKRVPPLSPPDGRGASSHHRRRCRVLWGEMLPLVYATLSVTPLRAHYPCPTPPRIPIKQIIPPSPPPPAPLLHTAEELLIYIFGHDTFQVVVVTLSVCPQPTSPSSILLNDFLLPLASLPLCASILHKSARPLYPSKSNDHHLFSSAAVNPPWLPFLTFICLSIDSPSLHLCCRAHTFYLQDIYAVSLILYSNHSTVCFL